MWFISSAVSPGGLKYLKNIIIDVAGNEHNIIVTSSGIIYYILKAKIIRLH